MAMVNASVRKRCSRANRSKRPIMIQGLPSISAQLRYTIQNNLIAGVKVSTNGSALIVLPKDIHRNFFEFSGAALQKQRRAILLLKKRSLRHDQSGLRALRMADRREHIRPQLPRRIIQ